MIDDAIPSITRRTLLAVAGAAAGGAAVDAATARNHADDGFAVVQAGDCVPITPLSGDAPVEDLYAYQLPAGRYAGANGARDDGGPYFGSAGTRALQRDDASVLFLYRGPEGLSLVVVHGSVGDSPRQGGTATFRIAGLPDDGEWVVRDDYYLDPETGRPADTNYDEWNVTGDAHAVAWTWGEDRTDGGAFRGLGDAPEIRIDPAFNDAADDLDTQYAGTVTEWEVLSGRLADPDRYALDLGTPVTIRAGDCDEATPTTRRGTTTRGDADRDDDGDRETDSPERESGGDRDDDADRDDADGDDADERERREEDRDDDDDDDRDDDDEEEDEEGDEDDRDDEDDDGEYDDDEDDDDDESYEVCHRPPGNPDNAHTVEVGSENALDAHLAHGDSEGECGDD